MSSYVLYLPGIQGANPKHLEAVGLGELLRDGSPEFADCLEGGPDGGRGMLAAWRSGDAERDPPFGVRGLTWQPAKADKKRGLTAKRWWLGMDAAKPVKPEDIASKQSVAGYPVTLADGNVWRIPAAANVPHVNGLDDEGCFTRKVAERYREFWDLSGKYAVEFFNAIDQLNAIQRPATEKDNVSFGLADGWLYCCQAIAINYRVTPEIVDLLGLLDDPAMRNVIKATINLPCILEDRDQKKTADLIIPVG